MSNPRSDPNELDAQATVGVDQLSYAAALAELERILATLDDDHLDVDHLAAQVRRASELIRWCRGKIVTARFEVETVVAELDDQSDPG